MKRLLVTMFALSLLAACGTEVGNGFKPNDKKEESNRDEFKDTAGESAGGGAVPTSGSIDTDWTTFLFAPCASPFSEAVASRYVRNQASLEAEVTGDEILVTMENAPFPTTPLRTGTLARAMDTAFAFDIRHVDADELMAPPASATCGTVSTGAMGSDSSAVTRHVDVTSLGVTANVSWRLDGAAPGIVGAMSVTFADGTTYTFSAE